MFKFPQNRKIEVSQNLATPNLWNLPVVLKDNIVFSIFVRPSLSVDDDSSQDSLADGSQFSQRYKSFDF